MMQLITTRKFVQTIKDIWDNEDRRICFVLGAGASRSSGIRTGNELAKEWLTEIKEHADNDTDYAAFLDKYDIDESWPGQSYPHIYQERFRHDLASGFNRINREMEVARPGYGYSVLAQLLAEKQHNIVITTNFDNLTEEALYTYTEKRPLVCGHELLAAFAKPSNKRPLIVKIHRDRLFDPMSQPEEVDRMNDSWVAALNSIFGHNVTPVFIGYGGNDGSLMGYLDKIRAFDNIFWCEIKGTEVPDKVKNLLQRHKGKLVEIDGFDELMSLLQGQLGLPLLNNKIKEIAEERAKGYEKTLEKIAKRQAKSQDSEDNKAAQQIVDKAGDSWWTWELKAQAAKTDEEKKQTYQEGLTALPKSHELMCNYALFLRREKNDYAEADKYYRSALELYPDSSIYNGNYASFLRDIYHNYDEAEKYYQRALELDPNDSWNNAGYALFLEKTRKKYNEAEKYHKKAVETDPENANFKGNYAGLLLGIGKKDEGRKYLEAAYQNYDGDVLLAELYFYQYAHFPATLDSPFQSLKGLLCKGIRSKDFDLQLNVDRAIQDGHPDPDMLQRLANILTKDEPVGDLCN